MHRAPSLPLCAHALPPTLPGLCSLDCVLVMRRTPHRLAVFCLLPWGLPDRRGVIQGGHPGRAPSARRPLLSSNFLANPGSRTGRGMAHQETGLHYRPWRGLSSQGRHPFMRFSARFGGRAMCNAPTPRDSTEMPTHLLHLSTLFHPMGNPFSLSASEGRPCATLSSGG